MASVYRAEASISPELCEERYLKFSQRIARTRTHEHIHVQYASHILRGKLGMLRFLLTSMQGFRHPDAFHCVNMQASHWGPELRQPSE
jgi:hypothetical protein